MNRLNNHATKSPRAQHRSRGSREPRRDQPASGTLEVMPDGYGFLRRSDLGFVGTANDTYVPRTLIERFDLATGSQIEGLSIRGQRGHESPRLREITSVDDIDPSTVRNRIGFDQLKPVQPFQRLRLETPADLSMRIVDLFTPIGKGQRGLIVSPPRAGKTILLQNIARSLMVNHPECHVIILLIDERPEEVTDFEEFVGGPGCEVVSSTFDQVATCHTRLAKIVLGRARRMVESGRDVVLLVDSITRLTRAHNTLVPSNCKVTTGGFAMEALGKPKELFGSARAIREPGSLTILATALVDTGTRMDGLIFEEFKGTGNMEIHLSRKLVEREIWPAIDLAASATRRAELLIAPEELQRIRLLRKALSRLDATEATERLMEQLGRTGTNSEFLQSIPVDR